MRLMGAFFLAARLLRPLITFDKSGANNAAIKVLKKETGQEIEILPD
jgi:hypothetical protein